MELRKDAVPICDTLYANDSESQSSLESFRLQVNVTGRALLPADGTICHESILILLEYCWKIF